MKIAYDDVVLPQVNVVARHLAFCFKSNIKEFARLGTTPLYISQSPFGLARTFRGASA